MPNSRLTKQIFLNDLKINKCTWSSQALKMLKGLYSDELTLNDVVGGLDLNEIKQKLYEIDQKKWKTDVEKFPKLRTYRLFKNEFGKENYTDHFLSKNRRSTIAQMRTGTSFLRIETGRYERQVGENGKLEKLPAEKRICKLCDSKTVEDELHFILKCEKYRQARSILRYNLEKKGVCFEESNALLCLLLSEKNLLGLTADYLEYALMIRKASESKGN